MPTTNPVPSYDPTDLLFNAQKLDEVVNSTSTTYTDRSGVQRRTLAGLEAEFPNAQANSAAAAASATAAAASATQAANEAASAATAVDLAFAEATAAQAARTGAESARDAAQLNAGIYDTTALGIAATISGQYFSVPGTASTVLTLYKNNAGVAQPINSYPATPVARLGRVQFSRRGTTFLFNDPAGTSVEVGWSTLRFFKGETTPPRRIADRPLTALAAGNALYIDVATDTTSDYPVLEATLDSIAIDVVQGTKILLVANYVDGYLLGELAQCFVNKEMQAATAAAQTTASGAQTAANNAQTTATTAQTNSKAARRVIVGEITSVSFSGGNAIVSISEGFAYKEANSGNLEKKIAPLTGATLSINNGIVADLVSGSVDGLGRVIPTVVAIASGAQTGWQSGDKYVLAVYTGTLVQGIYQKNIQTSQQSSYSSNEVVVIQRADEVDIYMKGSNPTSNRYLRYRMQRKPSQTIGSDVWRWNEVWEVERTGDYAFTTLLQICNNGENEMAIQQFGKSDFMGGAAHGDEELFTATMLIDGDYVALGGTGNYRCRRVEFLQGSDMYEVDTVPAKSNRVAKSYKRWIFENGNVELFNNVAWEKSITLSLTFMTMLTLLRWNGDTQISDRGYRAPLYLTEDISNSYAVTMGLGGTGFTNGETVTITDNGGSGTGMEGTATVTGGAVTAIKVTKNGTNYSIGNALTIASKSGTGVGATGTLALGFPMVFSTANIAKASGPTGYSAEVEILEGWDKPGRQFNFSNSAAYNKFYFDFTGANYVTQVGEVLKSRARYKLETKN